MSKVLFINGTAQGHLNPTFPLVKELHRRGEEVFYFSTADFRQKIEASGAAWLDYGEGIQTFFTTFKPSGNHPFYTLIEFLLNQDIIMSKSIIDKSRGMHFDYIIHDAMMGGGNIVAHELKIPAVCSCTSFAANKLPVPPSMLTRGFHPQLDHIYELAGSVAVQYGFTPDIMDVFFKKEPLNIVYTSRLFQPVGDGFDDSFKFVGPSINDRHECADGLMDIGSRKLIYISMGTINNNIAAFYRNCMEAFKDSDMAVIMSVGSKTDIHSLGEIPKNCIVRNYIPQLEVMKRASAFISHGGLNSVSEALYFGVPVVVIPLANDQPAVARQLVSLGAGVELKMEEVSRELLQDSVNKLIDAASYKEACGKISDSFVKAGGFIKAADEILSYINNPGL